MKKLAILLILPVVLMGLAVPTASAADGTLKAAGKSLLIPGWGQYQNGEFETEKGRIKVGVMAAVEVAAIVTTAVVGGVVGYPLIWIGIGLFIGNHVWSALDAFINAKEDPSVRLGTASPKDKVAVVR
jgi:hypothetical protein